MTRTLLIHTRYATDGTPITGYAAAWRRPDGTLVRHAVATSDEPGPATEERARRVLDQWAEGQGDLVPIPYPD